MCLASAVPTRGRFTDEAGLAFEEAAAMTEMRLSPRERQVAILLALGHTNQQVASSLAISVRTAEVHRTHAMEKLHARSRVELVAWALENDLLH
jgi:DNA-binding NarL/FixJ family response regulator